MTASGKGLVTVLACSAVFTLVAIPLVLRWVPRNRVYGYRTRLTLSSDALWYRVNAYFARRFIVATGVSAGIAVALYRWPVLSPGSYLRVSVVLLVAPAVVACVLAGRFARVSGGGHPPADSG